MTTWINLKGKMLSEICQRYKCYMESMASKKTKVKLIETESKMVFARS